MSKKKLSILIASAFLALPAVAETASLSRQASDAMGAVRPQDDLFTAVNADWLRTTVIPDDKSEYGSFRELRDKSDAAVRDIVARLASTSHPKGSVEQKVADLYASYLDTAAIDKAGLTPILPRLAEIDAIDSPSALAKWMGSVQGLVDTPVTFGVIADFKNPDVNISYTFQGGLGLPDRDYYLKTDDKDFAQARDAYAAYLTKLAELGGLAKGDAVKTLVQREMALETRLAEAHWSKVDNRDMVKLYNPMTIDELASKAPGFDWKAFQVAAGLGSQHRLVAAQPSTDIAVAKMVSEMPIDDWKVFAKFRLLDANAQMLPKPWRDAHFAFHGAALSGVKVPKARWQQSIDQLNGGLGEAVGQLYVQQYFPPAQKARMLALVNNLLATYRDSIDQLDWMSAETKKQAREKLAQYAVKIGYPDKWRDYSTLEIVAGDPIGNDQRASKFEWARQVAKAGKPVDRSEWIMTPQTVNAGYNPMENDITFPAAILQPPFFDVNRDDAYNYGAIGAVIGHEISHGFDDEGSQFDGHGALRNWWTDADRKAFEALGTKLAAQFDAYEPLPGHHVNGKLTLGENIADLSGLQMAFKAWQRSLAGKPAPVVDGKPGEQRFFIGWAEAWRSKQREADLLKQITSDPHAPDPVRANGAAMNSDAYQQAFGTKPGDKMFKPENERVRIW